MIAEVVADLTWMRTCEGMWVVTAKGRLRGKAPKLTVKQEAQLVGPAQSRGAHQSRAA
ncbi:hypothetical protein [Micromonospora sp. WMMD1274]|uniref:hypothetical protein n=1 Tax=unclassified Micromonospora TaxID=2617518 RepID=UPI003B950407